MPRRRTDLPAEPFVTANKCQRCGKKLSGRQRRFCSNRCRVAHWRERHPPSNRNPKGKRPAWVEWCKRCEAFTPHRNLDTHTRRVEWGEAVGPCGLIVRQRTKQCANCGRKMRTEEVPV